MIKVIASDMDGTLLGDDHRIAPETLAAIRRACDAGIRFMVATGRNFPGAMEELKGTELTCDYVVSSGAEVRNPQQEVVKRTPISIELCDEVYNTAKKYPVSVAFFTDRYDYRIGTKKEIEDGIIQQIRLSTAGSPEIRKGFPISVLWKAAVRRYIRSSFLRQMWSSWRNSEMS